MQVSNISYAPAIVNVDGKTKTERQLSVIHHASTQTKMALAGAKGKVGNAARNGIAFSGRTAIAAAAAKNNYLPAAQYFAAKLGQPFVITNRNSFEALPDVFEAMIMKAKMAKNGGYTQCKKTGALKPSATLALAMELKAESVEMIATKEAMVAEARAESKPAIAA
jgi:hypothetical protein